MFTVSYRVAVGCVACADQHVFANSIRLPHCSASHVHLRSTNISKGYPPKTFLTSGTRFVKGQGSFAKHSVWDLWWTE
jgi:hypothetical protein